MDRPLSEAEGWRSVYDHVMDRIDNHLFWSLTRLYAETGVSEGTFRSIKDGNPAFTRQTWKGRKMCLALGWSQDSIERILKGDEPLLLSEVSRPDGADVTNDDLDSQIAEQERLLKELRRRRSGGSSRPDQR